jgi:hypothetical protein
MRYVARLRLSLAGLSVATFAAAAFQVLPLELAIPVEHLRLAWTLTRVLVQL